LQVSSRVKVSLVIFGSVAIGILLGSTLVANVFYHNTGSTGNVNQGLTISGTETVKVLAPDGSVVSTWKGPDPLSPNVQDAIAGCATGIAQPTGSVPYGVFSSCEDWIGAIALWTDAPSGVCTLFQVGNTKYCTYVNPAPATNTLTPLGCTTGSSTAYGSCTGWITEATFGPTTFTSTSCGTSCGVEEVTGTSSVGWAFDSICSLAFNDGTQDLPCLSTPIATVAPQDSLLVTIDFSVT
jgi:hypothetical protein